MAMTDNRYQSPIKGPLLAFKRAFSRPDQTDDRRDSLEGKYGRTDYSDQPGSERLNRMELGMFYPTLAFRDSHIFPLRRSPGVY